MWSIFLFLPRRDVIFASITKQKMAKWNLFVEWCGMVWYGMVWYMVWCGMTWHGTSYLDNSIHAVVVSGEGVALVFCLFDGRSSDSSNFCRICFSSNIIPKNNIYNNIIFFNN